jgi:hypothetical protein
LQTLLVHCGQNHVRIEAICAKASASPPAPGHEIYPFRGQIFLASYRRKSLVFHYVQVPWETLWESHLTTSDTMPSMKLNIMFTLCGTSKVPRPISKNETNEDNMKTADVPAIKNFLLHVKSLFTIFCLVAGMSAKAQQDQDNWYLDHIWTLSGFAATNGGLSSAYGIAIGPSGLIYVADQGNGCIQVYQTNFVYSFSITNGFGGGQSFSEPRGMVTDKAGNLYVADLGNNCVYEFTASGAYIQKFGSGTGSGNGQLNGVMDVAVDSNGLVYVLENANSRISVFNANGSFKIILVNSGALSSQLASPVSITISDGGTIVVAQNFTAYQGVYHSQFPSGPFQFIYIKAFDINGNFLYQNQDIPTGTYGNDGCGHTMWLYFAPSSVRFDHSGLLHCLDGLFSSWYVCNGPWGLALPSTRWDVFNLDGSANQHIPMATSTGLIQAGVLWPCSAIGPDGTMIFCDHYTSSLQIYRYAKREIDPVPRNASSMPEVLQVTQRTNTGIVDVYYEVTDQDDTNTFAAMLVFTNGTQSLSDCLRPISFTEGTSANINAIVPTGQPLHVTWNAGADWPTTNLSNFRIGLLAKDTRQGYLDAHYLNLPSNGLPALEISASPLVQADFTQVWWWLLATNDPGIRLSNSVIYGVGGSFNDVALCNGDNNTTTNGTAYIFQKMGVRQATAAEVSWASQGPNFGITGITNQWTPTISVVSDGISRPMAVNEYGFDTGNWGADAWWIVPLQ